MRFIAIFMASLAAGLAVAQDPETEGLEKREPCDHNGNPITTTSSSSSSTSSSVQTSTSSKTSSSSSSSIIASPSTVASTSTTTSSSSTTTLTAATVTPSNPAVVGSFVYDSCVAEPFFNGLPGVRALQGNSTSSSSMTVEYCASFCSGYTYFGVEYSSQCYCGNTIANGTTLDNTAGDCNNICSGNAGEYCGGSGHLNLYQLNSAGSLNLPLTYTVTSSSTTATATATGSGSGSGSASASSTVVPTAEAASGSYNFIACGVEAYSNGASGRSLTGSSTVNNTAMTVEFCASFCSGYTFFGVEYGDECYCGNSVATGTTQDTTGAGCNMACAGNPAELCGGSSHFNLYELASNGALALPTTYTAPTTSTSSVAAAATSVIASISSSSSTVINNPTTSSTSSVAVASGNTASTTSSTAAAAASTTSSTSGTCAPSSADITSCSAITQKFPSFGSYKYNSYYTGSGYTLASSNPANLWSLILAPITVSIPANNNACQASSACMLKSGILSVVYHSFDLHWRTDTCAWECTMYAGQNTVSSYFNVPNQHVSNCYGFSGSSC